MTIEQLAAEATDAENFSFEGNVMVEQPNGQIVSVSDAHFDSVKNELILRVARQENTE